MDKQRQPAEMTVFSLSQTVSQTAEPFLAVIKSQNKTLEWHVEEGIALLRNEDEICQLTSILLDNAMKDSNSQGHILLTLKRQARKTEYSVWNTVEQISKGPYQELFERFYRGESSRSPKTGGYGIGLALAKAITETHKGKITARSEDGHSLKITALSLRTFCYHSLFRLFFHKDRRFFI